HIHAGGDHRRRMDQCAYWSWTFHRVRQPDVKGELRRLADGADKQKQADGCKYTDRSKRFRAERRRVLQACEYTSEIDPIECPKDEHDPEQESEVAYAVYDECFLSGVCRGFSREPKSDKQI